MPEAYSASMHPIPVPASTSLIALDGLVLDLETTGLDVQRDRIVQIAALQMRGQSVASHPVLDSLINPGVPIAPASTRIHTITDTDVIGAPGFATISPALLESIGGRVVIGHHIAFDLAVLRFEAARHSCAWYEPAYLDLAPLAAACNPGLPDLGLETIAGWLEVEITDRHSAHGDCLTTAACFARLIPKLRERGIRTLGEALRQQAIRDDLQTRQAEAGWFHYPSDAPALQSIDIAGTDSHIYRHRLQDVQRSPLVSVSTGASLREAAQRMFEAGTGSLLILNDEQSVRGILSERDLLRASARASVS